MKTQQQQLDDLQLELERGFSSLSSTDNVLHKKRVAEVASTHLVENGNLDELPQIYTVSPTLLLEEEYEEDSMQDDYNQNTGGVALEFASDDDEDEYSFSL